LTDAGQQNDVLRRVTIGCKMHTVFYKKNHLRDIFYLC